MSATSISRIITLAAATLLLAACAQTYRVDVAAIEAAQIANYNQQDNLVFSSGQPTQEQLPVLATAGIRHVISLRPASELDWNEQALVEANGMMFHSIPVAGADGVTSGNAATLESLLESLNGQPVLVHCSSSNRVGALRAVTAHDNGASVESALAEGRQWGLTRMEDTVREKISAN